MWKRAVRAGLDVDKFAPRLSFFLQRAQQFPGRGREVSGRAPDVGENYARSIQGQEWALVDAAFRQRQIGGCSVDVPADFVEGIGDARLRPADAPLATLMPSHKVAVRGQS